jgi:hypothetical protein
MSSNLEFGNHFSICLRTEENQENLPKLVYIIFKNLVRTSKRTLHFTITKINWLTLFKEIKPLFNPLKPKLV